MVGAISPRWRCLICGRDKFAQKTPHYCNSGWRKRRLKWEQYDYVNIPPNLRKGMSKAQILDEISVADDSVIRNVRQRIKYRKLIRIKNYIHIKWLTFKRIFKLKKENNQ